jgi:regulatory protein
MPQPRPRQTKSRKPPVKLDGDALLDYAVRSLSDHASSSDELRLKLRRRAANSADIESVIARLVELKYLDDKRFAEMYTTIRVENDGFGRARVLNDLRARRVNPKLAEQAVSRAFEDKDEAAMVAAWIERRMPSVAAGGNIGDERKLAAAYRKLRRAGFSGSASLTALKKFAAHPELLDEPPPEDEPSED